MKNIGHHTKGHRFGLILHKKGARWVVLNQVQLGLRWTLGEEDNQESVPIVEVKDTEEIIVQTTLHLDNPHRTTYFMLHF